MNSKRGNREYVALTPSGWGSWRFNVSATAETVAETFDEMLVLTERLFGACSGFIRPIEFEYSLAVYESDLSVSQFVPADSEHEPRSLCRRTLSDETGVGYGDFVSDIPDTAGEYPYIRNIEFVRTDVRLSLDEYDDYTGRDTPGRARLHVHGELTEHSSKEDPLHLNVTHCKPPARIADSAWSIYDILISTPTGLWFEDTEIGSTNRYRLQAFFRRLREPLKVIEVRTGTRYDPDLLEEFVEATDE